MKKCKKCGYLNKDNVKFCENDGFSEFENVAETSHKLVGGMALVGAFFVIIGFVLPWFSINLLIFSGHYSGLTGLVASIVGLIGSFAGASSFNTSGSGYLILIMIALTIFIALVPIMGYRAGKTGYNLIQKSRLSTEEKTETSRKLISTAIIGSIPLICFLASSGVAQFSFLGFSFGGIGTGVWVTFLGFILSFIGGVLISASK